MVVLIVVRTSMLRSFVVSVITPKLRLHVNSADGLASSLFSWSTTVLAVGAESSAIWTGLYKCSHHTKPERHKLPNVGWTLEKGIEEEQGLRSGVRPETEQFYSVLLTASIVTRYS